MLGLMKCDSRVVIVTANHVYHYQIGRTHKGMTLVSTNATFYHLVCHFSPNRGTYVGQGRGGVRSKATGIILLLN